MTGLVVLVVTLLVAGVAGLVLRTRNGQVRVADASVPTPSVAPTVHEPVEPVEPVEPAGNPDLAAQLEALGVERGERLTLLQFSSTFCTPCRATRTLLADVARTAAEAGHVGVRHVEVDVAAGEAELALVRSLDIRRTPTTVILDGRGHELARASGVPRREQVLAVVYPPGTPPVSDR